MRTESGILGGVAAFLALLAAVYWFWSYEVAGTVLLVLGTGFAGMVAVCLRRLAHGAPPRPEDRTEAAVADGAGDLGWFPTASIWPLGTAGGAVLLGMGLVFGVWLALVGGALLVASALGYALADRVSSTGSGSASP